jgi:hypothetical protein
LVTNSNGIGLLARLNNVYIFYLKYGVTVTVILTKLIVLTASQCVIEGHGFDAHITKTIEQIDSVDDCKNKCQKYITNGGVCKSATYDSKNRKCMMHSYTKREKPGDYKANQDYNYFEPGCGPQTSGSNSPPAGKHRTTIASG